MFNVAALRSIFRAAPDANLAALISGRPDLEEAGLLESRARLCYFLAQLAHESIGLGVLEENLRYRAERLAAVWPSRFPSVAVAQPYAMQPEKLANKIYGGRMGNVEPGDGWRYRGRGFIHLTGRDAYREAGARVGVDLEGDPDLAAEPVFAVKAACGFWLWRDLNPICDAGDFELLTRRINGGLNGLAERERWLRRVEEEIP
ncbi:MAG: glycoside hydrolase family 19 protein [Caulobacteraceae bacterium]